MCFGCAFVTFAAFSVKVDPIFYPLRDSVNPVNPEISLLSPGGKHGNNTGGIATH